MSDVTYEEIELSGEMLERIDDIHNAVYELCKVMTEKSDLEWNMEYIGDIADTVASILNDYGFEVRYPAIITETDGTQHIEEFV